MSGEISREFSLLNRYFRTTLLYQFFFDQAKWNTISPMSHNSLRVFAEFGRFFERFWHNRFLKGQTTSVEIFQKIFITKQILLHNFALPVFFGQDQMEHHIINSA